MLDTDSGIHAAGVDNHLLVGFEAHFMRWTPIPDTTKVAKNQSLREVVGTGRKPTIIRLNEHDNEMMPYDTLLHMEVKVPLSCHH